MSSLRQLLKTEMGYLLDYRITPKEKSIWRDIRLGNFSKSSQIEPLFLYSMCMGEIRSHAKFQVSSFNILEWQPLFVNQS